MGDKVKESIEELMFALEYDSWSVQKKTAKALVKIGRPAVKPLIAALRSRAWIVREGAAEVTPTILSYLQPLRDWSVQKKAAEILVEILVKIGKPAIEPLIAALRDGDFSVGAGAAEALVKIDPDWPKSEATKRQVPKFIAALRDGDLGVSNQAAWALGKIGDFRAVGALTSALRDEQDENFRKDIRGHLKKIKGLQAPLLKLYHLLLCTKCRLRAERKKERVILLDSLKFLRRTFHYPVLESYPYVVCRGCGSSLHLIKGVKEVIGLIGGDVDYYRTDGERVYVSLWSEAQKQARNADIDLLEIRNSSGITYDYAINAVLQTLKNDVSRPAEYVKGIPVILTDNPPLSENARRILEDEFGGIKQDA